MINLTELACFDTRPTQLLRAGPIKKWRAKERKGERAAACLSSELGAGTMVRWNRLIKNLSVGMLGWATRLETVRPRTITRNLPYTEKP